MAEPPASKLVELAGGPNPRVKGYGDDGEPRLVRRTRAQREGRPATQFTRSSDIETAIAAVLSLVAEKEREQFSQVVREAAKHDGADVVRDLLARMRAKHEKAAIGRWVHYFETGIKNARKPKSDARRGQA